MSHLEDVYFELADFMLVRHSDFLVRNYSLGEKIGDGAFSNVYMAEHCRTGIKRAVKKIRLGKDESVLKIAKNEVRMLQNLDHPYIVKLIDVFKDSENYHLVIEYCKGVELFTEIAENQCLKDTVAAKYTRQILLAVRYMHR